MKISKMKKKILVIWDLDGFIGAVNSTYPYNYNFSNIQLELTCVRESLELMKKYSVKTTFAITGFSAEEGLEPYTFPNLINEICLNGHEIASHSWRHEWVPLFRKSQIDKSLFRSKKSLESAISKKQLVTGFVPPHNKPSSWLSKGAFSLEDRGLFPFFQMGDLSSLFSSLKLNDYKWVRIAHNPLINKFSKKKQHREHKIFNHNNLLVLQNHYMGFDKKIVEHIESTNREFFIVTAHPVMLAFKDGRPESWEHFEAFIRHFSEREDVSFVRPMDLLEKFGIQ